MENFNFIESGLIFGLCESQNFKAFTHPVKDFAQHGETYKFIQEYLDEYTEFPTNQVLIEKFPHLSTDAQDTNFQYALAEFKKQVMQHQKNRNGGPKIIVPTGVGAIR